MSQPRISLTDSINNFYLSPGGTDCVGGGRTPNDPCKTRGALWDDLCNNYDLRGNQVIINLAPGVYDDPFIAHGSPPGLRSYLQRSPVTSVPLAQTKQITFRGDLVEPRNVVIQAINGPAYYAENGAWFVIEGQKLDGRLNTNPNFPIVTGASWNSGIGFGRVVFGNAPNQIDVQPTIGGSAYFFDSYEIDHSGGTGVPNLIHISQDPKSLVFYQRNENCPQIIAHMRNGPRYSGTFLVCDGAITILGEGPPAPSAAFRGLVYVAAASIAPNGGLIFNSPYDGQLIFTPEI